MGLSRHKAEVGRKMGKQATANITVEWDKGGRPESSSVIPWPEEATVVAQPSNPGSLLL